MKRGYITIALFAAAATLLTFSAVSSSRAALTYYSQTYAAEMRMYDIGVTLTENGEDISRRNYINDPDTENEQDNWDEDTGVLVGSLREETDGRLQLGHTYKEELAVRNSGTIDHYMRVTVYKYWAQPVPGSQPAEGDDPELGVGDPNKLEKRTDLDPGLIDLHFVNTDGAWYLDESASTKERTVLYYREILPAGETSAPFTDTLTIQDEGVMASVSSQTVSTDGNGNTVITTAYDYDGVQFVIQADVDAVQTHNAADAIRSAWGVEMADMQMIPAGE